MRRLCEDCAGTGIEQMPVEPDDLLCEFCHGDGYISVDEKTEEGGETCQVLA